MATNEILPFCGTDTGTNLLTQAEYDADSQRPIGNQPGVARSKLVNKVLKQSSLLAAALAQYLADKQATDITDDLTPSAIAALIDSVISASITVPDASTTVKGKVQLATNAEAQALSNALNAITPSTLDNSFKGSNQSLTATGYQKLPGGLIIQWGKAVGVGNGGTANVTFPVAFTNLCAAAFADAIIALAGSGNTKAHSWNKTGMAVYNGDNGTSDVHWLAIGY
jgi:hypothetical protein